jgi:hypothetical protein
VSILSLCIQSAVFISINTEGFSGKGVEISEAVACGAAVQAAACRFGSSIDDIRTAWAPATRVAAEPRTAYPDPVIAARYASVASWTGGDTHVQ